MMGAEHRIAQVQVEASAALSQLKAQHQEEIARLQHAANVAHGDLNAQLQKAEQQNQNQFLCERLELQKRELAEQQDRFNEMHSTVLSLQDQLTIVRNSSIQPTTHQNGADFSELHSCISALRAEVRQMKDDRGLQANLYSSQPVAAQTHFNIVAPTASQSNFAQARSPAVSPSQSACAGFLPEGFSMSYSKLPHGPPGPPSSSSSSSSKSPSKGRRGGAPGSSVPTGFGGGDRALTFWESRRWRWMCRSKIFDESLTHKAKAQFGGWKNPFLTKASSIDKTGQSRIMTWLLEAFSASTTVEHLEQTSMEMPRLDAYLASQLMDHKHLKGDLSRGANLTQQSLPELDLGAHTYEGLRTFIDRIEFVL